MPLRLPAACLLLVLAGCAAGSGSPVAGRDVPVDGYPWCADEARASAEQPVAPEAEADEARLLRSRHISQACARARRQARDAQAVQTTVDRLPHPHPVPVPRP
ncbi:hypothetical protein LDO32_08840 [Luteimonas sp. Y-2-2-4F]|nr:hypothetical protein [Luteimonas sp. Y-2-2-4F]MCD9031600.1 hypothetical protein [Luteimonas sp. Y-2-2-4F]MCD9031825.1 hypothetical protein [Luteimonas sp. Y-2-2-4F]